MFIELQNCFLPFDLLSTASGSHHPSHLTLALPLTRLTPPPPRPGPFIPLGIDRKPPSVASKAWGTAWAARAALAAGFARLTINRRTQIISIHLQQLRFYPVQMTFPAGSGQTWPSWLPRLSCHSAGLNKLNFVSQTNELKRIYLSLQRKEVSLRLAGWVMI